MNISPVAQGQFFGGNGGGQANAAVSEFETFLTMLTVQMRNQDPLNPMEASDFAVQLATFSGVEQQVRTNKLLEALAAQASIAELSGLVGMTARAAVPAHFSGEPVKVAVERLQGAEEMDLVVRNAMGNIVDTVRVPQDATSIAWSGLGADGPVAAGRYSFELAGYAGGELIGSYKAEVYAPVVEARRDAHGTLVVFPGGVEADVGLVTALRRPEAG